jgi:hypothetical protein
MGQNKKNVQDPKSDGWYHEGVHGHQRIDILFAKYRPHFAGSHKHISPSPRLDQA